MSAHATYKFRLYIAGEAENSMLAVANLTALCRTYLPDRHHIEIVDVFKKPKRALAAGVLMTPMLVKLTPGALKVIVGTLSETQVVLQTLGLAALPI